MFKNKITKQLKKWTVLGAMFLFCASTLFATSHREAPLIANDPLADNTDLYAFRSPDDPNTVTIIANYIPMQLPHGGPNYATFGTDVRYEIHIDNDASIPGDEIIYRFTFSQINEDPTTFFNIRLGKQNLKTTYTMERSMDGGATFMTVITDGIVPPNNIGPRSIESGAGLGTTYEALVSGAISTTGAGEKVFAGPVDDPFFVDLGGIFDLGNASRQGEDPRDGLACYNVNTIAIQVPISMLLKAGAPATPTNILDPDYVIGVWASASRQAVRTFTADGIENSGDWVQVSRIGMPLTNEAVIPIGSKDYWNAITPYDEIGETTMDGFFFNPELALYMDDDQFGSAVPAFAQLRIQKSALGAFDFSNGGDGLFGLKGSDAVAGTALDDAVFGTLLLPGPGMPRSVDLWPAFHTGVPNVIPYQLATGKNGDPLAAGKPFINNFLPNGGDMLRLNMAVPITSRDDEAFSSLGIVNAAVLGLTDPTYASNADLEFIPNMDGFPNGRRLEDDVTRIELQAVGGIVLAAVGLWYDDFDGTNPVSQDLIDVLSYTTGVETNDVAFRPTFPYLALPFSGTGNCSGQIYTPVDGPGPGPGGEMGVDLELAISTPTTGYGQYEEVDYTLTLTNNGDTNATGISVSAGVPTGLVFTNAASSVGEYDLFTGRWMVPALGAGESATLILTLFTLDQVSTATSFVQVMAQDQEDADSEPGNNNGLTPQEDDEASLTINIGGNGGAGNGQLFVSSNTQGKAGVFNLFDDGAISMNAFDVAGMDADGISYDRSTDRMVQLNRTDNVINIYDQVNFALSAGNTPNVVLSSTSDFTNGREIAVNGNWILVAQDANDGNGNQNRLLLYLRESNEITLVKTHDVDFNLWGIHTQGNTVYAIIDNSDQLAIFDDFYSLSEGPITPNSIVTIEGIIRTHGITYDVDSDIMLLTDVGAASSPTDGAVSVINNFTTASADGTVTMSEQLRIAGSNTFLGNPVDIAYDKTTSKIYVAERANDGGRIIGYTMPTASGNQLPFYNLPFPGASAIYFANEDSSVTSKAGNSEITANDLGAKATATIGMLFPVPAINTVTATIDSPTSGIVNLMISDSQGRVIMHASHEMFEGQNDVNLDISKLSAGYYYLNIVNENAKIQKNTTTHKILKVD